jgi:hypothetical protein
LLFIVLTVDTSSSVAQAPLEYVFIEDGSEETIGTFGLDRLPASTADDILFFDLTEAAAVRFFGGDVGTLYSEGPSLTLGDGSAAFSEDMNGELFASLFDFVEVDINNVASPGHFVNISVDDTGAAIFSAPPTANGVDNPRATGRLVRSNAIPEPGSGLVAVGIAFCAVLRRRRR